MGSPAPFYTLAMAKFAKIHARALRRKGGEDALEELLPAPKSRRSLTRVRDDRYLSAMAKAIFRAGFVWKIVDHKWPAFEEAFGKFDIERVASMDEGDLDELATDKRVIRNRPKLAAVRDNARFVIEVAAEHGSFARYIAAWPEDDIVGLWLDLKKRGSRLGGFSGPLVLRTMGKDTFMLTGDVVTALINAGVVDKQPTSQRALRAVQDAFNGWREETGRPLCELSRILACSVDS